MRAARTDANQEAIVARVRASGLRVVSLARLGEGVPDLLVMSDDSRDARRMALFEVKNPAQKRSAQLLTPAEELFFERHHGCDVHVATTALGIYCVMSHGVCPTSDTRHCTCLDTYGRKRRKESRGVSSLSGRKEKP
jgi:hypothetical protein